jgi:hypothetical protein
MKKNLSSISKAASYEEMGEFWDTHDLSDFWDQTRPAHFEVDIQAERFYYAVDKTLSGYVQMLARKRGISPDTLVNLWIQEKVREQKPAKRGAKECRKRS